MGNRLGYTLKVLIAEDERDARERIRDFIHRYSELEITGVATSGMEALDLLKKGGFDLVFLDVRLPGMSGMEILNCLRADERKLPKIIFVTAFGDFALEAFEQGAVDFILKPLDFTRFQAVMERMFSLPFVEDDRRIQKSKFAFHGHNLQILVPLSDIHYFQAAGKKSLLCTAKESVEIPMFIGYLMDRLPEEKFMRVHKQYVANLSRIRKVEHLTSGRYQAHIGELVNSPVPVGRKYAPFLRARLEKAFR